MYQRSVISALIFTLAVTPQHAAYAQSGEEKEIVEAACKVEKYLGDAEYNTCLEKQRDQLQKSASRSAVLSLPPTQLNPAKEKCVNQKNIGIDEYYSCIQQHVGFEKTDSGTQAEAKGNAKKFLKAKPAAKRETFKWPKWTPLPLTMPANQSIQTKSPAQIFNEASSSVYTIIAAPSVEAFKQEKDIVLGSAVAITDSLLLTNCHVVSGNNAIVVMQGEYMQAAFIVSAKPDYDKCILATPESTLIPINNIRGYKYLNTGERAYAIGSPNGLQNSISEGMISGLRGTDDISIIQTSAAISHGSSGGGLFDVYGNLIGITTFMLKDGQALNFAIAIDEFFNE